MTASVGRERSRLLYEEARAVLDAQNQTMSEIEDKAMRLVQFNGILLGLVIAAARIDPGMFNLALAAGGVLCFMLSALAGISTVDESNLFGGVGGAYLRDLVHTEHDSGSIEVELIETFSGMIEENEREIRDNSRSLRATNILLIAGILITFAAVPL